MNDITGAWIEWFMWTGVLLGTLGTVSAEALPIIWILIEINLISFIPLFSKKWNNKKVSMLYFVVQRIGSLTLLCGGFVSDVSRTGGKFAILGLLMKASLAPFHFWGGPFITNLSPICGMIFLTWQKIAPIFLLYHSTNKSVIHWIALLNALVASLCALGSKSILLLLFFSGLIHAGWILVTLYYCAVYYFAVYIMILTPIFIIPGRLNLSILMLNLAGLPPLTGFMIKLLAIQGIEIGMGGIFLALSALFLFCYLRIFLLRNENLGSLRLWTILFCRMGLYL